MKLSEFDFRIWDNNYKGYIFKNRTISKYSDSADREDSLAGRIRKENHYGDLVFDDWSCDCEIELFTGLYDKGGVKIFAGDILNFRGKNYLVKINKKLEVSIITEYNDSVYMMHKSKGNLKECKVIGNIHENEKLLK
ncbi:hypothetical protein XJ45_07755 [Campylobacter coli]|nr:hypothetical protein [Campylobacter coli]